MAMRKSGALLNRKTILAFSILLYLAAVAFSVDCLTLKRDSLHFNTRDYPYFVEQAARLADPSLINRTALNIDGYNFLGLQGTQSVKNIYQALHLEVFRYTYTLVYWLFHSTLALFIYYALLFFLPILYFAFLPRPNTPAAWLSVVLFSLLYVLIPAALPSVTYDLRPRVLLLSGWCLAVLAVYYRRPFLEKLILFLFLLCLREEGFILGGIVLVLNFIRMPATPARRKQTLLFLFLVLADMAAFLAFLAWGEYTQVGDTFSPLSFFNQLSVAGWAILAAGAIGILAMVAFVAVRRRAHLPAFLFLLVYAGAILMIGLFTYRDANLWYQTRLTLAPTNGWDVALYILAGGQNSLLIYILVLLLVLLLDFTRGRARSLLAASLGLMCIVFAVISVYNMKPKIAAWRQDVAPARLVWDFKASLDRHQTHVLLDYNTYQAFYDFENDIVYNRLPLWMVYPEDRFYPDNKDFLPLLIRDRMQYAVISQESLANVRELAALAGLPARVIAANDHFVVLQFR